MANAADYEFISCLIDNVRQNKCLYDKKDQFYFNKFKKERAWDEIAKLCNKNIEEVKQKWKLLREKYVKETRKLDSPSGSACCYENWQYYDDLSFLKDSIAVQRTLCNEMDSLNNDTVVYSIEESADEVRERSDCLSPALAKRSRVAIEKLYNKFGEVVDKVEKTLLVALEPTTDELLIGTMVSMIKDLPFQIKGKFYSDMMAEVLRLRAQICEH